MHSKKYHPYPWDMCSIKNPTRSLHSVFLNNKHHCCCFYLLNYDLTPLFCLSLYVWCHPVSGGVIVHVNAYSHLDLSGALWLKWAKNDMNSLLVTAGPVRALHWLSKHIMLQNLKFKISSSCFSCSSLSIRSEGGWGGWQETQLTSYLKQFFLWLGSAINILFVPGYFLMTRPIFMKKF